MSIDLLADPPGAPAAAAPSANPEPWTNPAAYWRARSAAVADVSAPVASIDLAALRYNALDLVVRSSGVPIRVASKSIRVREVLDATLALPGYRGILAFTLPEALWLANTHDDIVLGYPSVDRAALAALAAELGAVGCGVLVLGFGLVGIARGGLGVLAHGSSLAGGVRGAAPASLAARQRCSAA